MTMPTSVESLSIIVPTHDRAEVLAELLESLSAVQVPPGLSADLLVVDNACSDDTTEVFIGWQARLPLPARVVGEPRLGLNHARNRGVRDTTGEVVAFLDDDVTVEPNWLEELVKVFETERADMVGGRVSLRWLGVEPPSWLGPTAISRLGPNERGEQVFWARRGDTVAIGCNFAVRREVFRRAGVFRTGLDRKGRNLLGGGETELVGRAMRAGFRCCYAPQARAHHRVDPERLSRAYLRRGAFYEGVTSIVAIEHLGPTDVLWQIGGRSHRLARHVIGELAARLAGDEREIVENRLQRAQALGGFTGIWNRLVLRRRAGPVESL